MSKNLFPMSHQNEHEVAPPPESEVVAQQEVREHPAPVIDESDN